MHVHHRVGAIGEHRLPPVRGRSQAQQDCSLAGPVEFEHENTRASRGIAVGVTHPVGAERPKADVRRTVQRRRRVPE